MFCWGGEYLETIIEQNIRKAQQEYCIYLGDANPLICHVDKLCEELIQRATGIMANNDFVVLATRRILFGSFDARRKYMSVK